MVVGVDSGCGLQQRRRSTDAGVDYVEMHYGERSCEHRNEDGRVHRTFAATNTLKECRHKNSVENHRVSTTTSTPVESRCRDSTRSPW